MAVPVTAPEILCTTRSKLAATFLRANKVVQIFVGTGEDAELEANKAVSQTFVHATDDEKDRKLYDLCVSLGDEARIVVFANTKRRVDHLSNLFWNEGFGTSAIHGAPLRPLLLLCGN